LKRERLLIGSGQIMCMAMCDRTKAHDHEKQTQKV
jgi:hypothetical protein